MWLPQWLDSLKKKKKKKKKKVKYAKISPRMVNPRDMAGECDYLNGLFLKKNKKNKNNNNNKLSNMQKSHQEWWTPEIWLGNSEEEEEEDQDFHFWRK